LGVDSYRVPRLSRGDDARAKVPVRLDPHLQAAVEERAAPEHASMSEIIRKALRKYLDAA
jgi:Arc/MetJ-type ribon-helix-helix transcriptional regulator